MTTSLSLLENGHWFSAKQIDRKPKHPSHYKLCLKRAVIVASSKISYRRRLATLGIGASLVYTSTISRGLIPLPVKAEEKLPKDPPDEGDNGVLEGIKSLFDPNEKTKSGKVLPKAYLKAAREVVKTLRESLEEDPTNNAKFRRSADAAKESIREYLNGWRGQKAVIAEVLANITIYSSSGVGGTQA